MSTVVMEKTLKNTLRLAWYSFGWWFVVAAGIWGASAILTLISGILSITVVKEDTILFPTVQLIFLWGVVVNMISTWLLGLVLCAAGLAISRATFWAATAEKENRPSASL